MRARWLAGVLATGVTASACSAERTDNPPPVEVLDSYTSDADADATVKDDGGLLDATLPETDAAGCKGLQCARVKCDGGGTTSISGTVYAPNGKMPLYNVIVYVPNADLSPLPSGVSCDRCGVVASGEPIVVALTDSKGRFRLDDVPVGKDIPLVIQLGKWRRRIVIPEVLPCQDNKLTSADQTRLPKKRSEGDMPKIAATTGACDKVLCMLPKVGIDASEYGVSGAGKAVTFFSSRAAGGPSGMKDAKALWNDLAEMKKYDIVILSCECDEAYGSWTPVTKDTTSFDVMTKYLDAGGRVFSTDFQYTWYKYSPDPALRSIGVIEYESTAGIDPVTLDTSFPKAKALFDWLKVVDSTVTSDQIKFDGTRFHIKSADKKVAQVWATAPFPGTGTPIQPIVVSANTPVGKPVEAQCGKAMHLNVHVNDTDKVDASFPAGCTSPMKQGEEVLAFFFFDLSACIQRDTEEPKPPPIK